MKAAVATTAWAAAAVLLGACSGSPAAAHGAPACMARAELLDALKDGYAEQPVAIGVTNDGRLIEVTAVNDGETWTIVVTEPGGPSCAVIAGEGWHQKPREPAEPGA